VPVPRHDVRLIKLANLAERMAAALQSDGLEAMRGVHKAYRSDPATAGSFTQADVEARYEVVRGI
jgi:hypothetical protein